MLHKNITHEIDELERYNKSRYRFLASKSTNQNKDAQVANLKAALLELKNTTASLNSPDSIGARYLEFIKRLNTLITKELSYEFGDLAGKRLLGRMLDLEKEAMSNLVSMGQFDKAEAAYKIVDDRSFSAVMRQHGQRSPESGIGNSHRQCIDDVPRRFREKLRKEVLKDDKKISQDPFETKNNQEYRAGIAKLYARISGTISKNNERDRPAYIKFHEALEKKDSKLASEVEASYQAARGQKGESKHEHKGPKRR